MAEEREERIVPVTFVVPTVKELEAVISVPLIWLAVISPLWNVPVVTRLLSENPIMFITNLWWHL